MKIDTGRCAILFPHGVLFRDEENDMRRKLIDSDYVECVIGIGKNLFFNSGMEACILICRIQKPLERKGKVLFINAKNEVTRKNSESYLEDSHIDKISSTYNSFIEVPGFSGIATIGEIQANKSKLSIPLYVDADESAEGLSVGVEEAVTKWIENSYVARQEYAALEEMLKGDKYNAQV